MIFSENCRILLLLLLHCLLLPFAYWLAQEGANSETFEAYIFGCIGVRTVELDTSSLAIEVSSEKGLELQLTVRAAIGRFSQSLIHLLVDFKEQSLMYY